MVTDRWGNRHTPHGRIYVTSVCLTVTILRHQRPWRRYICAPLRVPFYSFIRIISYILRPSDIQVVVGR